MIHRTAQVDQQRLGGAFICPQTRNCEAVHTGNRRQDAPGSKLDPRHDIKGVETVRAGEPQFAAKFHAVTSLDPMKRVSVLIQR